VKDPFGNWYEGVTFDSLREAEKHERQLMSLGDQGKAAQSKALRELSLACYWQEWQQECRSDVSEGWKLTQDQMWRDHVEPHLGSMKLVTIRAQHIQRLLNRLKEGGLGSQTRLHVYNLLHKMFEDAYDHDPPLVEANPVRRKIKPKVIETERGYLAPDDAKKLLETAKGDPLGVAIWLGVLLGLRCEAIQALKVGRVDFRKKELLICECFKRRIGKIRPFPKGKKWEYVPLPDFLIEYLRPKLAGKSPDDFVVNGERKEMLSYNAFLRGVKRLCRKAGVKVITPHELRHSASELWIEMGASEEDVRRLLNQKSSSTTKRYLHRSDERLKRIAQLVGFSEPAGPSPRPPLPPEPAQATGTGMAKVITLRFGK
jgi:integrase